MGEYIGLFEFASWSWLRRRNILLCMGAQWVSIDTLFPMLQERTRGSVKKGDIHIAAAYWNPDKQHWSAVHNEYRKEVQHYVIAVPAREPLSTRLVEPLDLQLQQLGCIMIPTRISRRLSLSFP